MRDEGVGRSSSLIPRPSSLIPYPSAAFAAFICRVRRDLRRAAAFLWIMPRLAALSTTLAVCWRKSAACSSPLAMAARVFFTNVLIADFTDWFRSARTREMRRLRSADLPLCVFGFGTCSNSPLQENRSPPRGEARHYSRNHQPDTSAKDGPGVRHDFAAWVARTGGGWRGTTGRSVADDRPKGEPDGS